MNLVLHGLLCSWAGLLRVIFFFFPENLVSPSLPGWFCKMSGYFKKKIVKLKITLLALLVLL